MEDFATRLKVALKTKGWTQSKLADVSGIPQGSISNYLRRKYDAKTDAIQKIATALGVNPAWLIGLEAPMFADGEIIEYSPVGAVQAGYGVEAQEDWSDEVFSVPAEVIGNRSKDAFTMFTVKGDSMLPEYHNGDNILVLRQIICNQGEVAVVQYGEDTYGTLKKVYIEPTKVTLKPINPEYESIIIEGRDLENFKVIGVPKYLTRII